MERLTLTILLALAVASLHAQEAERALRQGNSDYKAGNLAGAIEAYGKADKDERGMFNLGNAFYRQDSLGDAQRSFENAASMAKLPADQARAYHNLGNSFLRQGNFPEAITAYKEALKRVPSDEDTRYNLAYAQKLLQKQEQQQKQQGDNKDQQDKQDQQKNQDQKDQGQQDRQDQGEKDRQQDRDEGKDKKEQQDKGREQQKPGQIAPQDATRMLDAAQQQEKDVQDKVRQMMQPKPVKPAEKDW